MLKARLAPDDVLGSEDIEDLIHDIKEPLLAHPLQELRARFIKKNQVGGAGARRWAREGTCRVARWTWNRVILQQNRNGQAAVRMGTMLGRRHVVVIVVAL